MKIDAIKIKGSVIDDLLSTLDGVEGERLKGRSQMAQKMRKDFPGDSLGDALGDHYEAGEPNPDPEEDKRNKIVR